MKVHVDEGLCAGHALCSVIAPDVFEVDSRGKAVVIGDVTDADVVDVEDAVAECPAHALVLTRDTA